MNHRNDANWLWQYGRDLPRLRSLSGELEEVALGLSFLCASYDDASRKYSRMLGSRLENALSDYWRAVSAWSVHQLDRCSRLTKAARIESSFIKELMEAENTEADLGEGEFFEFNDNKPLFAKLNDLLERQELEMLAISSEIKKT